MNFLKRTKVRTDVYDWLRGLASIAVICGHFYPFNLSKNYFAWAVHAFVLLSMALLSSQKLTAEKLIRRIAYLVFVYLMLIAIFHPIFRIVQGSPHADLSSMFLKPSGIFIDHPYFMHLWYLALYLQMIFFVFFTGTWLNKANGVRIIALSFIVSQILFLLTYFVAGRYRTIFLPSWCFVMACGYYGLPRLVNWSQFQPAGRKLRCTLAFAAVFFFWIVKPLDMWLSNSETRMFALNTFYFFAAVYFLMELYFLLDERRLAIRFRKAINSISRYTLILYIYHQGFYQLAKDFMPNTFLLTVFSIATGYIVAFFIHNLYLTLESLIIKLLRTLTGSAADKMKLAPNGRINGN